MQSDGWTACDGICIPVTLLYGVVERGGLHLLTTSASCSADHLRGLERVEYVLGHLLALYCCCPLHPSLATASYLFRVDVSLCFCPGSSTITSGVFCCRSVLGLPSVWCLYWILSFLRQRASATLCLTVWLAGDHKRCPLTVTPWWNVFFLSPLPNMVP